MAFHLHNLLPESYVVGPNDVIIGRGKRCTQNPGNIRFRAIIEATLSAYSNAPSKTTKSEIIMQVLLEVRASDGAGFVKQLCSPAGRFSLLEEASCRIAIAQAFRDALSGNYKSSKKHKQIRRIERLKYEEITQKITLRDACSFESVSRSMFLEEAPMPSFIHSKQQCPEETRPAMNMSLLRDLLRDEGSIMSTVFPMESDQQEAPFFQWRNAGQSMVPLLPAKTTSEIFSVLYTAFGNTIATSDPFEPTPIAEGSAFAAY
jgi:hypothetical protein